MDKPVTSPVRVEKPSMPSPLRQPVPRKPVVSTPAIAIPEPVRPWVLPRAFLPVQPTAAQVGKVVAVPVATVPAADSLKEVAPKIPKAKKEKQPKVAVTSFSKALNSLDMNSVRQMLLCVPSSFSDCRTTIKVIGQIVEGFRGLFLLKRTGNVRCLDKFKNEVSVEPYPSIFQAPYKNYWSRTAQLRVELSDEAGQCVWISIFNPWRMKGQDPYGAMLIEGELKQFGNTIYLTGINEPPPETAGKVWVRYVCPGAPSEAVVKHLVADALLDPESLDDAVHSLVTNSLLSESKLLAIAKEAHPTGHSYESLRELLLNLHEPQSPEEGVGAVMAARAMGIAGICNAAKVNNFRPPNAKSPINLSQQLIERLILSQPETLTSDQAQVIDGIANALRAPNPLNGLLSGDVGSGKTLAFLIPAVAVHLANAQVAIISPTEILANQVAANLSRRFPGVAVERVPSGGKIKNPQAILIGTSGLGSIARKSGYIPNLLIIDEQHKLATKDRNAMMGSWTHQLEASATPIPRSLASTLFTGMQVFNLTQAPVLRAVESFVFDETSRGQVTKWMREALSAQHRVAIIYPRVEKVESSGECATTGATDSSYAINSVNAAAEALEPHFPGRVGRLHGKMSPDDLVNSLQAFRDGSKPLVVASTIMETGIDVPDIRLLIVKDADRFGIAQLHQLRGRLARNGGSARFVMMVKSVKDLPEETNTRLETLRTVSDGYKLAEADMASRGIGDMAGNTQSGNISCAFRLLRLTLSDFELAAGKASVY